ncbi:MAG: hypothetical protein C0621_01425 [Desulfuromonas sp.]|nr:MAG: hypothetical protein C0621_01425 [Desulfuromonas sp.]
MPLLVLLLLILFPLPATALEKVTFDKALQSAVNQRPAAQIARQQAAAAAAAVGEAHSGYLPRLSLQEQFVSTNEPGGSLFISLNQERMQLSPTADPYNDPPRRRDFETKLVLQQPLYNPDITYQTKQAKAGAAAAKATARWNEEEVAYTLFRAYLQVQQMKAQHQWVESSLAEAEEIARLSSTQREAGTGLKADELRAQVLLSEAQRRQLTAENDLKLARRQLALAMGRDIEEIDIAAPLTIAAFSPAPPTESSRQDLVALQQKLKAADFAQQQSRAAYLPRLGVAAWYSLHDRSLPFAADGQSWTAAATLEWEIFDGLRRRHTRQRTQAEQESARLQLEEAKRQSRLALAEAELRTEEMRLRLASAETSLQQAKESYALLQQRYAAGLSPMADLLGACDALTRARFERVRAESGLIAALGGIQFQNGTFLQTFMNDKESSR